MLIRPFSKQILQFRDAWKCVNGFVLIFGRERKMVFRNAYKKDIKHFGKPEPRKAYRTAITTPDALTSPFVEALPP